MVIFVSACLLGRNCKYSGGNNYREGLSTLLEGHEVVEVCPEVLGGLSTPREPAEIVDGVVTARDGTVVDGAFRRGARMALELALEKKAELVILQSRSPSCGVKEVYDGSFTGRKIPGSGVFAAMAREHGLHVVDIEDFMLEPGCFPGRDGE